MARCRRRPLPQDPEPGAFNMTSMIDIVFQLLIFFMVTLNLSSRRVEDLRLPEATAARERKEPDVVVNLMADGRVRVNGRTYSDDALAALFDELRPRQEGLGKPLTIRADRSTKFEAVQKVMTIAAERGQVTRLQFAARIPE